MTAFNLERGRRGPGGRPRGGAAARCAAGVAALCAVAGLCAPGTAMAAVRPASGWYAGTTNGALIGLQITTTGTARGLRAGVLVTRCDDGHPRRVTIPIGAARGFRKSARSGRLQATVVFADTASAARGGRATITATFRSSTRASMVLRVRFRTPTGARCDSGTRRFTLRRRASQPIPAAAPARIFAGVTAAGQPLEVAMTVGGDALRVVRMRAVMNCTTGGSVTLDVWAPTGPDTPITATGTYAASFHVDPPAIPGRAQPSGGGVQISGRVTATGLDGAVRLGIGFTDGSSCDGGWTRFTLPGNTAAG